LTPLVKNPSLLSLLALLVAPFQAIQQGR